MGTRYPVKQFQSPLLRGNVRDPESVIGSEMGFLRFSPLFFGATFATQLIASIKTYGEFRFSPLFFGATFATGDGLPL